MNLPWFSLCNFSKLSKLNLISSFKLEIHNQCHNPLLAELLKIIYNWLSNIVVEFETINYPNNFRNNLFFKNHFLFLFPLLLVYYQNFEIDVDYVVINLAQEKADISNIKKKKNHYMRWTNLPRLMGCKTSLGKIY